MSGADLTRRAQKILHAVVTEYLHGGDAVGSRTVTRRHDLGLSPATVRNVMADLEGIPGALAGGLTPRSAQLEGVGEILTPIVAPGADALEDLNAALEGIPGSLTPRSAEAQLEVVGDLIRPGVKEGADALEELQTALEGGLIPN